MASGDFLWPWEEFDDDYLEDGEAVARPNSIGELHDAKQEENFWEAGGTHTILDVTERDITPLTSDELLAIFGTEKPQTTDLDRVQVPGPGGELGDLMGERWSGRSLVTYKGEEPVEVYFWGSSGD